MKTKLLLVSSYLLTCACCLTAAAQGTVFSYSGRLLDHGLPANGDYDLTFNTYDALTAGNWISGPVALAPVAVSNGVFKVVIDFGDGTFTGQRLWLEIGVRTNGDTNPYVVLSPRQEILPTPYAIFSEQSGNATLSAEAVTAESVANGAITAPQFNTTSAPASGQVLTFNGTGLMWTSPSGGGIWSLNGSSAYYNGGKVGIGTNNPQQNLTIAGVAGIGLQLTGNSPNGTDIALENTSSGGHKFDFVSGGANDGVGAGGFGIYDETVGTYPVGISSAGAVTINTTAYNPGYATGLRVVGGAGGSPEVAIDNTSGDIGNPIGHRYDLISGGINDSIGGGAFGIYDESVGTVCRLAISPTGRVGIGTPAPTENLTIAGVSSYNSGLKLTGGTTAGTGMALENTSSSGHKYDLISTGAADGPGAGAFGIYDETLSKYRLVISSSGTLSVPVLTITGGSDLAEPFKLAQKTIPKGSVVVIDEDHPGELKLSTEAYDTHVAGIVSGANGINPGIAMHQEGFNDGGQNVALSGRVYVQADAAYGAIKPGDLLTTSDTPGHAMRASDHARAQGAIIGKAMSGLSKGRGKVLVLVSLQ